MSKVEQVGAALRAACLEEFGTNWNNDVAWKFARAAIAAMREPTNAQRTAYYELSGRTEFFYDAVWERAIDAALQETDA